MPAQPVQCSRCGRTAEAGPVAALGWVSDRDKRGVRRWLCPDCARAHIREIEGKLDQEWW